MALEYTKELGDEICALLLEGNSLVKACKETGAEYRTIFKWIKEYPDFADNYTHAREMQADSLADGILDIADDSALASDDRRVKIDARKWYAGKLKPKKYGEKQLGDADNPVNVVGALRWMDDK
jgi:hypothetical protein